MAAWGFNSCPWSRYFYIQVRVQVDPAKWFCERSISLTPPFKNLDVTGTIKKIADKHGQPFGNVALICVVEITKSEVEKWYGPIKTDADVPPPTPPVEPAQ